MDNYKINKNGYIRVYINKKHLLLHRLVALTFLENHENKEQVNHKDCNKLNNCVENLEFVTNKENQIHIHKIQNGLGNNHTRKIGQYDLSGNLVKKFNSIISASKEMNVGKSNISGVLNKKEKQLEGLFGNI